MKEHISIRGIAVAVFAIIVAGAAIATILYVPTPPDVVPLTPTSTTPTSTRTPEAPAIEPSPTPVPTVEPSETGDEPIPAASPIDDRPS